MESVYERLIDTLLPGKILAVQVGLSRTAVMAETEDGIRCGLAATLTNPNFDHRARPSVINAGHLHEMDPLNLAALVDSDSFYRSLHRDGNHQCFAPQAAAKLG